MTRTTALVGLHVGVIVGAIAAIISVQPHYHGF
jgi:gas vesicle protein